MRREFDSQDVDRALRALKQAWTALTDFYDQLSDEQRGEMWAFLRGIDLDGDRQNKREIYAAIAHFLEEKLGGSFELCLKVTHALCGESDKRLLAEASQPAAAHDAAKEKAGDAEPGFRELQEKAKRRILAIKVHYYERIKMSRYLRRLEIYSAAPDQAPSGVLATASRARVEDDLDWYQLPPDVRELVLKEGHDSVSFTLYKWEG